jgi:DNA-binding HxlR family transcriptional regulator
VPERRSFHDLACSTAQALDVVGEWWTMLIVRDAFFGVRRFDDFHSRLGISRSVLTARLARLCDERILSVRPYQEHPPRYEYHLTRKGRDLFPVLVALMQWGDRWAAHDPPVLLRHATCAAITHPTLVCSECGEPVTDRNVAAEPGPGALDPKMLPVAARRGASADRPEPSSGSGQDP